MYTNSNTADNRSLFQIQGRFYLHAARRFEEFTNLYLHIFRCRFPHDIEKFMAVKPPDLGPTCYIYEKFGKCSQGLHCRFAGQHTTKDFKLIVDEDKVAQYKPQTLNAVSKDLRYHLRRREVFFPNADKYLESIGIKPSRAYRLKEGKSSQMTSGASQNETVNKKSVNSGNVEDADQQNIISSAENYKDLTACTGDLEKQAVCTDVKQHLGDSVNGENLNTNLNEDKSMGCVTDEDVIKIKPGEKKTIDFRDKLYLAPLTTVSIMLLTPFNNGKISCILPKNICQIGLLKTFPKMVASLGFNKF
jgi:tRNA-dihydrouridine synthase 3